MMNMSDENKSSNENNGVGAGGADVGSNPTPRTTPSQSIRAHEDEPRKSVGI